MHLLHHSSRFCILREANLNVGSRSVHARDNNSDTTTVLFVCFFFFLLVAQREFNFQKYRKEMRSRFVCLCVAYYRNLCESSTLVTLYCVRRILFFPTVTAGSGSCVLQQTDCFVFSVVSPLWPFANDSLVFLPPPFRLRPNI